MFTGIIETTGVISAIKETGTNKDFFIKSPITKELKIDQSVAHNGVCLTVVNIDEAGEIYQVTAIHETLQKTNLNALSIGSEINIERCMPVNGRFDGHIVQGHVDDTAICTSITDENGSWLITFTIAQPHQQKLIVDKGSITINGISLTVVKSIENTFSVAIIPYTWEHTNLKHLSVGDEVNIEFDIIGKYVSKMLAR